MGRAIEMEREVEKLKLRISTMEKRLDVLDDLEKLKNKEKKVNKKLKEDVKNLKKNNKTVTMVTD